MRPILSTFIPLLLAAALLAPAARATEVPTGPWQRLPGRDAAWRLVKFEAGRWLEITDDNGVRAARYELDRCHFCSGEEDGCDATGVFPILIPDKQLPVLGAVCLSGAHSAKGWVFDPDSDANEPVLTVTGAYFVQARVEPMRIVFRHDDIIDGMPWQNFTVWPADAAPEPALPPTRRITVTPPATPLTTEAAAVMARFRTIARNRDRDALLAFASEDILVSFGGFTGPAGLADYWELHDDPDASALWPALERLLAQPAALDPWDRHPSLLVPYYLSAWPRDLDGFDWLIARGPDVPLRVGPAPTAPLLTRLDRAAVQIPDVRMDDYAASDGWTLVRYGESYGYVADDDVDSPIGLRATIYKRDGRWQLIHLVAGD